MPVVSFLVNAASGVIRQAIDRVAIAGSRVGRDGDRVRPLAQPGERARGVLDVVLDRQRVEARASSRGELDLAASRHSGGGSCPSGRSSPRSAPIGAVDQSGVNVRPLLVEIETVTLVAVRLAARP